MARLTPNEVAFIAFAVRNDDAGERVERWRELHLQGYDKCKSAVTRAIAALMLREDAKDVYAREEREYESEVNRALRAEANSRLDMAAAGQNLIATSLRSLEGAIANRSAYLEQHPDKSTADLSKLTDSAAKWADKIKVGKPLSAEERQELVRDMGAIQDVSLTPSVPVRDGDPKDGPIAVATKVGRA